MNTLTNELLNQILNSYEKKETQRGTLLLFEANNLLNTKHVCFPLYRGLTVISGPNGSGKSTFFEGLMLVLNGDYKLLKRGDNRSNAINQIAKDNDENCDIHLFLYDPDSSKKMRPFIKLQLTIQPDNRCIYKIDNKAISTKIFSERINSLHIDPNNICQIASQNRIDSFKMLKSIDRFAELLNLWGNSKNTQMLQTQQRYRRDNDREDENVPHLLKERDALAKLKIEFENSEETRRNFSKEMEKKSNEKVNIERQISTEMAKAQKEYERCLIVVWVIIDELKRLFNEYREFDSLEEEIKKVETELNDIRNDLEEKEGELAIYEDYVREFTFKEVEILPNCDIFPKLRGYRQQFEKFDRIVDLLKRPLSDDREKIMELESEIAMAEDELRSISEQQRKSMLEKKELSKTSIEAYKSEENVIKNDLGNLGRKRIHLKNELVLIQESKRKLDVTPYLRYIQQKNSRVQTTLNSTKNILVEKFGLEDLSYFFPVFTHIRIKPCDFNQKLIAGYVEECISGADKDKILCSTESSFHMVSDLIRSSNNREKCRGISVTRISDDIEILKTKKNNEILFSQFIERVERSSILFGIQFMPLLSLIDAPPVILQYLATLRINKAYVTNRKLTDIEFNAISEILKQFRVLPVSILCFADVINFFHRSDNDGVVFHEIVGVPSNPVLDNHEQEAQEGQKQIDKISFELAQIESANVQIQVQLRTLTDQIREKQREFDNACAFLTKFEGMQQRLNKKTKLLLELKKQYANAPQALEIKFNQLKDVSTQIIDALKFNVNNCSHYANDLLSGDVALSLDVARKQLQQKNMIIKHLKDDFDEKIEELNRLKGRQAVSIIVGQFSKYLDKLFDSLKTLEMFIQAFDALEFPNELQLFFKVEAGILSLFSQCFTEISNCRTTEINGHEDMNLIINTLCNLPPIKYCLENSHGLEKNVTVLNKGVINWSKLPNFLEEFQRISKEFQKIEAKSLSFDQDQMNSQVVFQERQNKFFNRVEEHLTVLSEGFANLFGSFGFKGNVSLIDKNNIVKTGIDINAAFPHLNEELDQLELRPLSKAQFSGGEESMIFTSFLLSLHKVSPSPFRCLDEINRGLSNENEKKIMNALLQTASEEHLYQPQHFVATPKLDGLPEIFDTQINSTNMMFMTRGYWDSELDLQTIEHNLHEMYAAFNDFFM
eukprot:TRINITY_DN2460_c0_g1_i1.p1 TRINITY_DN2460_c0_g1~~TRINITY_DN2460_c0_g1_i1.p1  ORF type:complete len:1178 (+),score=340.83 TRINITY_DN2460_c0_g1_i1:1933-5466(+)